MAEQVTCTICFKEQKANEPWFKYMSACQQQSTCKDRFCNDCLKNMFSKSEYNCPKCSGCVQFIVDLFGGKEKFCALCSNTNVYEGHYNHGVYTAECTCWFCVDCYNFLSDNKLCYCGRCGGNISDLFDYFSD